MSSKIFGLCENPVASFDKALRLGGDFSVPVPDEKILPNGNLHFAKENFVTGDEFVNSTKKVTKSNAVVRMRNGIGKLMESFSKVKI